VNMLMERREASAVPVLAEYESRKRTALAVTEGVVATPSRRRFDRVSIGLCVGGISLGAVGCTLGACMPYHHPVAVAISVIWWGVYIGCFGASLGALVGLFTGRGRLQ